MVKSARGIKRSSVSLFHSVRMTLSVGLYLPSFDTQEKDVRFLWDCIYRHFTLKRKTVSVELYLPSFDSQEKDRFCGIVFTVEKDPFCGSV